MGRGVRMSMSVGRGEARGVGGAEVVLAGTEHEGVGLLGVVGVGVVVRRGGGGG